MGNTRSAVLGHFDQVEGREVEHEDVVFVIPRHINFTPLQMSTMIANGQQPGVPFRVGGAGAQRPSRPTRKAHIVDNVASIHKNSVDLIATGNGDFSLSFKYDALNELSLFIFFGSKDANSTKEIRPKRYLQQWGPFDLPTGRNSIWNSADEFVTGDIQHLTCSYESDKSNNLHYDIIIVLDSSKNVKTKNEGVVTVQASYFSINSSTINASRKLLHEHSASPTSWNNGKTGSFNTLSQHHASSQPQSHPLFGVTGKISLTCRQQKIHIASGDVYVVQDLYGMNKSEQDTEGNTNIESASKSDNNERDGSPSPLDTDSSECVICLTDEKEVVVYPCRHMCMCITCAEALPSQNNKCPMCRRPASMLLRLKSKNKSKGDC